MCPSLQSCWVELRDVFQLYVVSYIQVPRIVRIVATGLESDSNLYMFIELDIIPGF